MDGDTPIDYWKVKENCIKEASIYKNRSGWKTGSPSSYKVASEEGWREECSKYLKK